MRKGDRLFIRADANKKIGMGHIMRCLTIAEAANRADVETWFLVADEEAAGVLAERGQQYTVLHSDYADMESELPALKEWLQKLSKEKAVGLKAETVTEETAPETWAEEAEQGTGTVSEWTLLLDSYQITEAYVKELRELLVGENIKMALLTDYGNIPYQADCVINYNIYGVDFDYTENAAKALLGCDYMPLRPVFAGQPYEVRQQVKNILVTTGGSDRYRIAETLAEELARKADVCVHVVCGKFSESREALLQLAETGKNVKVYWDVKQMWELMAKCDVAVSAAGTTLYELCAVGVPTICFSFADNQILPGITFAQRTPMLYAGDYEKDKKAMFEAIFAGVERLCGMSKEERGQISNRLKEVVDGKGAERIVSEL